jgi:hypothetical protein
MPPDEVTDWAARARQEHGATLHAAQIQHLSKLEANGEHDRAESYFQKSCSFRPATISDPAPAPTGRKAKPKRRDDFRQPQSEAGRITGDEGWRELRDIERHAWDFEREHQAMLFAILRIAHTGKRWIAIGRRELASKLGCDGKTAYRVLEKLVEDGYLIRRSPERRFDPKTRRYNADEYTFPRLAEP